MALRMTTEMVAALIVGGGIGWVLDRSLGTRPWLMVVFLVIGMAAGLVNIARTAQRISRAAQDGERAQGAQGAQRAEGAGVAEDDPAEAAVGGG